MIDENKKDIHKLSKKVFILGFALIAIGIALMFYYKSRDSKVIETDLELSVSELVLLVDDEYTVNYKLIPENSTDKSIIWYSNDNNIAVVFNGKIKAVSPGVTKVNAQTVNGIIRSILVISTKTNDLKFDKDYYEFNEGDYIKTNLSERSDVKYTFTDRNVIEILITRDLLASHKGGTYLIAYDSDGNFAYTRVVIK
jgi:hypothetical protein